MKSCSPFIIILWRWDKILFPSALKEQFKRHFFTFQIHLDVLSWSRFITINSWSRGAARGGEVESGICPFKRRALNLSSLYTFYDTKNFWLIRILIKKANVYFHGPIFTCFILITISFMYESSLLQKFCP